jgi:hypothetical protein
MQNLKPILMTDLVFIRLTSNKETNRPIDIPTFRIYASIKNGRILVPVNLNIAVKWAALVLRVRKIQDLNFRLETAHCEWGMPELLLTSQQYAGPSLNPSSYMPELLLTPPAICRSFS